MQPDLEVVPIGRNESFRAWEHGYPFSTVRWHFHPEYEVHQVVATSGRYFVGDFIGSFDPGNLVMTGPNLPHNWISDVGSDEIVPLRNRALLFLDEVVRSMMAVAPELQNLSEMLDRSRSGILFSRDTSREVAPLFAELVHAIGVRRIELFIGMLGAMQSRRRGAPADQRPLRARSARVSCRRASTRCSPTSTTISPNRSAKPTWPASPASAARHFRATSASTPGCRWFATSTACASIWPARC